MGDPTVVGEAASEETRARYFTVLDEFAVGALSDCKHWLGGARYEGKQCDSFSLCIVLDVLRFLPNIP
jgi:hypothetical protein